MKYLILDGSNIQFRSFWIGGSKLKHTLQTEEGFPTGGIYIALNMIKRYVKEYQPDEIYCCWDTKADPHQKNFRKQAADDYKAGRDNSIFTEMIDQEALLRILLQSLGVKHIYPQRLEADDIISYLAQTLEGEKYIVTSDKDMLQLVSPVVHYINIAKKQDNLITVDNFLEKVGIEPEYYVRFKALQTDQSDNIQGLKGFGKVKSAKFAREWNLDKLTEEQRIQLQHNLSMVDLSDSFEREEGEKEFYEMQVEELKLVSSDWEVFEYFCKQLQFGKFVKELPNWKKIFDR